MPKSPLSRGRTLKELKWLWPTSRFELKETNEYYAVWMDNEPQASFVGQSWEEVMGQAVREAWKGKD